MVLFWWKHSKIRLWWWLCSFINVLKNIKPHTLNGRILQCINSILMKLLQNHSNWIQWKCIPSLMLHTQWGLGEGLWSEWTLLRPWLMEASHYHILLWSLGRTKGIWWIAHWPLNFHREVIHISSTHVSLAQRSLMVTFRLRGESFQFNHISRRKEELGYLWRVLMNNM